MGESNKRVELINIMLLTNTPRAPADRERTVHTCSKSSDAWTPAAANAPWAECSSSWVSMCVCVYRCKKLYNLICNERDVFAPSIVSHLDIRLATFVSIKDKSNSSKSKRLNFLLWPMRLWNHAHVNSQKTEILAIILRNFHSIRRCHSFLPSFATGFSQFFFFFYFIYIIC